MSDSVCFEHAASIYEATRGGIERGTRYAAALAPHLAPRTRILEIGVGTGAIATPIRDLGHDVFGADLAPAMLATAYERLGARVTVADAVQLPYPDATFDAIVACWVLHLVGDQLTVIRECERVLRPEGRMFVIPSDAEESDDDMKPIMNALRTSLRRYRDQPAVLNPLFEQAGLALAANEDTPRYEFEQSPEREAQGIERREWSSCWSLDDEQFATRVQPHLDELRALPEPNRMRKRWHMNRLLIYERGN